MVLVFYFGVSYCLFFCFCGGCMPPFWERGFFWIGVFFCFCFFGCELIWGFWLGFWWGFFFLCWGFCFVFVVFGQC